MNFKRSYIVMVSVIVALGGFLMGFDASVISGVVKFIEPEFGLTKLELGWAVSSLTLTSTLAMLFAGPISDRLGRRRTLSIAAILYAISAISSALAPNFIFLVIARMIGGFGVGASLIIAPIYIAEISPAKIRGTMVSFNQFNIVVGISTAFFTNYLILKYGNEGSLWAQSIMLKEYNWRWMLGLETLPAFIYFFGLIFVPRSPRWLIMKGNYSEALEVLKKAVGLEQAKKDLNRVRLNIKKDTNKDKVRLKEIFRPGLKMVLTIGLVLAVLQQITGINSVFFYAPMIFEQSGLGTNASFTQAIWVGLTNLVFTVLAMSLIDKVGRKPLLLIGVSGIAISMMILSYGFNAATYTLKAETINEYQLEYSAAKQLSTKTYDDVKEYRLALSESFDKAANPAVLEAIVNKSIQLNAALILIGILAFVASFAVSIGPVMWVLFSELFPNRERAIAISFVGTVNSVVSFGVQLVFPWELTNLGSSLTFMIYGLFAIAGLLLIIAKVPETKGKSLEELSEKLIK